MALSQRLPTTAPVPMSQLKLPYRRSVAVIGGGAAGLVAARELQREGHRVVVYEQQGEGVGGVWRYSAEVEEEDPLGLRPDRKTVHTSMYHSLRTNLPREIMGYLDFPFLPKREGSQDSRRYPSHQEVLSYLQDFATHFNLLPCIRLGRRVTHVGIHKFVVKDGATVSSPVSIHSMLLEGFPTEKALEIQWSVVSEAEKDRSEITTDVFDAVVVCNGHYFQPKVATIPGIEKWPGKQLHSHNYRVQHPFADQVKSAHEDGNLSFEDGASIIADVILYCTGYGFYLPFLDSQGIVKADNDCVGPLYQHVFPPLFAPFLSFVGLPFKVIPFPLMQLQSKWIAMTLSGKVLLPLRKEMNRAIEEFYENIKAKGLAKSKIHDLSSYQFEYDDWLANQCGCKSLEHWRIQIYLNSSKRKHAYPDSYRDKWTDQELHETATAQLLQLGRSINYI